MSKKSYIDYKSKYFELQFSLYETDFNKEVQMTDEWKSKFFQKESGVKLSDIKITNASIYSVSTHASHERILDIITEYYPENELSKITLTDGTSHVGSDTIFLSGYLGHVNAIEISGPVFDMLNSNIRIYGRKNITTIRGDVNSEIENTTQDIILIDAPWGGPNSVQLSHNKLFLGRTEISDFYKKNKEAAKLFIFRVPTNYDFTYFVNNTGSENTVIHKCESYYLISIHNDE